MACEGYRDTVAFHPSNQVAGIGGRGFNICRTWSLCNISIVHKVRMPPYRVKLKPHSRFSVVCLGSAVSFLRVKVLYLHSSNKNLHTYPEKKKSTKHVIRDLTTKILSSDYDLIRDWNRQSRTPSKVWFKYSNQMGDSRPSTELSGDSIPLSFNLHNSK